MKSLLEKFQTVGIGQGPFYINLTEIKKETALERIEVLLEVLNTLEISPFFPYPIYIVSPYLNSDCKIPTVKTVEELPEHYNKKSKRLKGKEEGLLNKANFISRRLGNLNPGAELKKISPIMKEQKILFKLTVELDYYEKLHSLLESTKRDNFD